VLSPDLKQVVRCPQETQCTIGLSFDGTILECTDDEHCELLSTLFAVMVELLLMHGNTWYGIVDYIIETVMFVDDRNNVAVRQEL
jgi:hypothetical protein